MYYEAMSSFAAPLDKLSVRLRACPSIEFPDDAVIDLKSGVSVVSLPSASEDDLREGEQ